MSTPTRPGFFFCLWTLATAVEAAPVDFNQEIRPLLSNHCFRCHGPDEAERKAGLRLDTRDGALEDLGGYAAVVPGEPEESELLRRITTHDAGDLMPPPEAAERLSSEAAAVIERWIREGASYSKHWAYVPPRRPALPEVPEAWASWVRQDFDRFILQRLESEGLSPSPEADPHLLARRVALDLTGLPPRWEDVEAFVQSQDPRAFEDYVDGLLASHAFGEHWARHWLDLARYADSAGYADDPPRTIWAYRDYVIGAFNANKPFDEFTREQLAGDLLPEPGQEQLIATAFHRNTQTNNEGGTNDEEYRNVAVVDRVNTTFAVWMGTTMACAQCHTHKYDPITHEDYFKAFAIFNNTADADRRDESPTVQVVTEAFARERGAKQKAIDELGEVLERPSPSIRADYEHWQKRTRERTIAWRPLELRELSSKRGTVLKESGKDGWITVAGEVAETDVYEISGSPSADAGPVTALRLEVAPEGQNVVVNEITLADASQAAEPIKGRFVRIDLKGRNKLLQLAEVEVRDSTGENVAPRGKASQSSTYADADADAVASRANDGNTAGDYHRGSVSHTAVNQRHPWWEVDLGEDTAIEQVVVWNRTDGDTTSRLDGFQLSVLDENREVLWSRRFEKAPEVSLEVALDGVRALPLEHASATFSQQHFEVEKAIDGEGKKESGWALAPRVDEPQAAVFQLEKPSIASRVSVRLEQAYPGHGLRRFRLSTTADAPPVGELPVAVRAILSKKDSERTKGEERELYHYFASVTPTLEATRSELARLRQELEAMRPPTTVPVMRELPEDQRRETRIQLRGNYLDTGKGVEAGLPTELFPKPMREPDRLDLANWLMDPGNPLTARVSVNRFWEAIFGIGLVRTSEEFGSQGELPSHPAMLDWLALEFMENGWDVKAFLKLLVTSAAYRQTSKVTPALLERDLDNRLLARGPRFRLSAEMIRDQTLAVSGLLSRKRFGSPVKPRQPDIGLSAAFGSGIDWKTSQGEDQYRRGLYTTWRRSNPYPSMAAFDAPNREVCVVRRDGTNTPLQALVTLNDPVYMEAAQSLARSLVALNQGVEATAEAAIRRCLSRPATAEEREALAELFISTRQSLAEKSERALALATDPLGPAPEGVELADLAAWAVVGNVILNLDEFFLKP